MPFDATALLRHRDFVRAIAGRLLDDPHLVDDVEQETWAVALERPPRSQGALGAWLGQVAKRLAFRAMRTRERRGRRERAASPPRPPSSPDELAKILETQQRVVDAVLRLDPLYREVILLRFYESLPPRDVAARLGVPVNTVRTRTRRALELLRADLERGPSGRRALGLLPLLVPPRAARWTIGALLMSTKTKLAAVAALLLLTAGAVWQLRPADPTPRATAPLAVAPEPPPSAPAVCRLTGAVIDEAGRPVASARVDVASLETSTDAKGAFAIETPLEGPQEIVASDGTRRAQRVIELRHGEVSAGTLVLAATVTVTGVVLDEGGEGAPGAVVEAWPRVTTSNLLADDPLLWAKAPPPIAGSTLSGDSGAFRLALPRDAAMVLRARKGDAMSLDETGLALRDEAPRVVLRLRTLGSIRGRVVDLAGAPVAGASVHLLPPPRSNAWPTPVVRSVRGVRTTTAADGTFALAAPPEVYAVLVEHPAFVPFQAARVLAPREGWTIRLSPGEALTGVVEAEGSPVPGASVRIVSTDGHAAPQETVTDELGRFSFAHAALERPFHLLADGGSRGTALLRDVAWSGEPLRVALDPVADVVGRVELEDGTPVAGVRLETWEFAVWSGTASQVRGYRETTSAADGRFVLEGASRCHAVWLHPAEDRYVLMHDNRIPPDGREMIFRVTPKRSVVVRVIDGDGAPVVGAEVAGRAMTGDDGTCRILVAPFMTLVASKPGLRGTSVVQKEGDTIEIVMKPVPVLRGVVRGPDGSPLSDVRVGATYNGNGWTSYGTVVTGRAGAFAIDVAPDTELRVTFERTGFLPAVEMVSAGGEPLDVVLKAGDVIRGRVVDEEGNAISGVAVAEQRTVAWSQTTWTAADGRFVLDDVEPGARLRLSAPGYASLQMVETDPKSEDEQVFVLPRELVISGQVLRSDGTPAYPVFVHAEAERPPAPFIGVMTDAEGKFRIPGLLSGRYALRVDSLTRVAGHEDLLDASWDPMTGVAAGTTGVVLREKPPQVLAGIVVDEKDRSLRGARVNLFQGDEFVKGDYVDEQGRFRIPVRSGTYEVRVNLVGMAFKRVKGVASGTEDLVLRFAPGKEIRGQLDSAGGYAAGTGSVDVWSDDVRGYAEVDRFGGFTIRGLPAGTYDLLAWGVPAGGGEAMRGTARADAGAADVRIELKAR